MRKLQGNHKKKPIKIINKIEYIDNRFASVSSLPLCLIIEMLISNHFEQVH